MNSEIHGLRVLGHTDLGGRGDGMQLMTRGSHLYVGHSKPGHGTEHRPGAFVSENLIFVTYYNGGLRVVDIADPAHPWEVAWFVPPAGPGQPCCQTNDVYVTEQGVIYISERVDGGVWALAMD